MGSLLETDAEFLFFEGNPSYNYPAADPCWSPQPVSPRAGGGRKELPDALPEEGRRAPGADRLLHDGGPDPVRDVSPVGRAGGPT